MKKSLLALAFVLPLFFVGCDKEDETGSVSLNVEYAQLQAWVGADVTTVAADLESRGYVEQPYKEISTRTFMYAEGTTLSHCVLAVTDDGLVASAQVNDESFVNSMNAAVKSMKKFVQQAQNLLSSEEYVSGVGTIRMTDPVVENTYTSWSSMSAALDAISEIRQGILNWTDTYVQHSAMTTVTYGEETSIKALMVSIAFIDNALTAGIPPVPGE